MKAHIICHTHWDREWFFTAEYTNRLLPKLFENLFDIMESNPNYKFILDGQTRMVIDYLNLLSSEKRREAEEKLRKYARKKQLYFGPYLTQVDWLIPGSEALIRNLFFGCKISNEFGNLTRVGWLPDNFGQAGQIPQIHKLFGIKYIALWRGIEFPDDNVSTEFIWKSADGSSVVGTWFIDSPRNAYKLGEIPEIASTRVKNEIKRMNPFLSNENIMLLDGYDQDIEPENPLDFIKEIEGIDLEISDPESYMNSINVEGLSNIESELLKGRYVSVFPGKLSSNIYLKLLNYNLENLLTKKIEPINCMLWKMCGTNFKDEINNIWIELITLQPHDNISGVSADPINLRMEEKYLELISKAEKLLKSIIDQLGSYFKKRTTVAINTNAFPVKGIINEKNKEYNVDISPLSCNSISEERIKSINVQNQDVKEFIWENEYYNLKINKDGTLSIEDKKTGLSYSNVGYFFDRADVGDEYSQSIDNIAEKFTSLEKECSIKIIYKSENSAKISISGVLTLPSYYDEEIQKRSLNRNNSLYELEIQLDKTRLIKTKIKFKNLSRDHKLSYTIPIDYKNPKIFAEMPFEVVERNEYIDNSKPLPKKLSKILAGAREVKREYSFPMKDFVKIKEKNNQITFLTKGLVEYEFKNGKLFITLIRAVNYLSKECLDTRPSGAGPVIYTPYAQCLREMEYEIGLIIGNSESSEENRLIQRFHNPPLLIEIEESKGNNKEYKLEELELPEDFKTTAVKVADDETGMIIRGYNPTKHPMELEVPDWTSIDLSENEIGYKKDVIKVNPMQIISLKKSIDVKINTEKSSTSNIISKINKNPTIWCESPEKTIEIKYLKKYENMIEEIKNSLNMINEKMIMEKNSVNYSNKLILSNLEVLLMELELSNFYNRRYLGEISEEYYKIEVEKIFNRIWEPRMQRRYLGFVVDD